MSEHSFLNNRVIACVDEITAQKTDAIVNAANWTLLGGGGVDGAIHARGGEKILVACQEILRTKFPDGLPTGEAVITTGGDLPAKYVIHTVGPIYGRNKEKESELLANCYRNSLQLAVDNNLTSIAFPSISTGAFGYPRHEAAQIVSTTMAEFLRQNSIIQEVRLVFFQIGDLKTFLKHETFTAHSK